MGMYGIVALVFVRPPIVSSLCPERNMTSAEVFDECVVRVAASLRRVWKRVAPSRRVERLLGNQLPGLYIDIEHSSTVLSRKPNPRWMMHARDARLLNDTVAGRSANKDNSYYCLQYGKGLDRYMSRTRPNWFSREEISRSECLVLFDNNTQDTPPDLDPSGYCTVFVFWEFIGQYAHFWYGTMSILDLVVGLFRLYESQKYGCSDCRQSIDNSMDTGILQDIIFDEIAESGENWSTELATTRSRGPCVVAGMWRGQTRELLESVMGFRNFFPVFRLPAVTRRVSSLLVSDTSAKVYLDFDNRFAENFECTRAAMRATTGGLPKQVHPCQVEPVLLGQGNSKPLPARVLIGRRDGFGVGKTRIMKSWPLLANGLSRRSFTVAYFEDYSYVQKLFFFQHVKVLVMEFGSAVGNFIFLPSNVEIIQISPNCAVYDGGVRFQQMFLSYMQSRFQNVFGHCLPATMGVDYLGVGNGPWTMSAQELQQVFTVVDGALRRLT